MIRVQHPTRPPPRLGAGEPLLAAHEARAAYGGIEALRGISLQVHPGEIVALLGANGAGKTTTLRSVARLVPLTGGRITFAGRDVASSATADLVGEGMSLVPEGRAIFAALSVRENLRLGAWTHRDRRAMAETEADVVALFPRIGERMGQAAGTLSGGEQQMLAIGRALMARPSLLLLDEPSLGLAPLAVQAIFAAIRAIAEGGVAILLVEQNTQIALATSARGYVLRGGTVVMSGPSAELAARADLRAAYLG